MKEKTAPYILQSKFHEKLKMPMKKYTENAY